MSRFLSSQPTIARELCLVLFEMIRLYTLGVRKSKQREKSRNFAPFMNKKMGKFKNKSCLSKNKNGRQTSWPRDRKNKFEIHGTDVVMFLHGEN